MKGDSNALRKREALPGTPNAGARLALKTVVPDSIAVDRIALSKQDFEKKYGDRAAYTHLDRLGADID